MYVAFFGRLPALASQPCRLNHLITIKMNRHCFRLIFSSRLGMLVPVAEFHFCCGKRGQLQGAGGAGGASSGIGALTVLAAALLGLGFASDLCAAQMVVDPNAPVQQQAGLSSTANGVPLVDIANPNDKGLSHNRFSEFNVSTPGAVFNNSMTNGTSQIGGFVMRNPNLSSQAKAILAEVSGRNPSSLAGTLEVLGAQADLLIANPNGMTINGVTTLNIGAFTASTGRALDSGSGLQLLVDEHSGQLVVGPGGMDTSGLSYFDIVARTIAINGAVGSRARSTDISLLAGLNRYDTDTRTHTKQAPASGPVPGLAIEGSLAGAMHGRMISLISTESGAGVHQPGMIRSAQDIHIDAAGNLSVADLAADHDLQLSGAQVTIDKAAAGNDATVSSTAAFSVGALNAGRDVLASSGGDMTLGHGNSADGMLAGRDLTLQSQGAISNQKGSLLSAGAHLELKASGNLDNADRSLIKGDSVNVAARDVLNRNNASLQATQQLQVRASGLLRNQAGAQLSGGSTLLYAADAIYNDNALIKADNKLEVEGAQIENSNQGVMRAAELSVRSHGDFRNSSGASVKASGSAMIEATSQLLNDNASLAANQLTLKGSNVSNRNQGEILADKVNITATDTFNSDGKALIRGSDIAIDAATFTASDSRILASNTLDLNTRSYRNSATVQSAKNATLTLKDNQDLLIDESHQAPLAAEQLTLNAHDVRVDGVLNNPGNLRIKASNNLDNHGKIVSGKSLEIVAGGAIDNREGTLIWAAKDLLLQAGGAITNWRDGLIMAMQDMVLKAGTAIRNQAGRLEAGRDLKADAPLLESRSESSGSNSKSGEAKENTWYSEDYRVFETEYWHILLTMPVYSSDISVTKRAVIKAGGDLLLNQGQAKGTQATVRNIAGLMAAKKDVRINGNLENLGVSSSLSLSDLLKATYAYARWTNSGPYPNDDPYEGNLYELLDQHFLASGGWGEKWLYSLREVKEPAVNQVLSAVFGAEWKSLDRDAMVARWTAFKASSSKTLDFYADTQAEISAGQGFSQDGGKLTNGLGANWAQNRLVDVQIGEQKVQTVDGQLDASYHHDSRLNVSGDFDMATLSEALNAATTLSNLLQGNPLFGRAKDSANAPLIRPLYETRIEYIDQSQFYGSTYFFNAIHYNPDKSVTVLGDAYFDNQLILHNVERVMGNFFAVKQQLAEADLVKNLMDNAASEASKLGLVMGQPLSKEQYEKLGSDIVWYEPQVVDGVSVLAPRLYISKASLQARQQDDQAVARISGKNVLIDADAVNNINGVIRAENDAFVYAKGDINNVASGGADAGILGGDKGRAVIAAEGKVLNQGGTIGGLQQTVIGGQGVTSTATTGYDDTGTLVLRDNGHLGAGTTEAGTQRQKDTLLAQQQARDAATEGGPAQEPSAVTTPPPALAKPNVRQLFEAQRNAGPLDANAGSSVTVISAGDINLIGAKTQADEVNLQAGGDLNMKDLHEVGSSFSSTHESGFLSYKTTRETTAEATSKGNQVDANKLTVRTGGDWNVSGSDVNTQASDIQVAGNATVAAGKDLSFSKSEEDKMTLVFDLAAGGGGHEVGVGAETLQDETEITRIGKSQDDLSINGEVGGGRGSLANSGRGATSGLSMRMGIETVSQSETTEKKTHRNSQLNLGSGNLNVGGTFDLGGADINKAHQLDPAARGTLTAAELAQTIQGMPTLDISAGEIKSSKFEDTSKTTNSYDAFFVGYSYEGHSSLLDVATNIGQTAEKAKAGMEVDPGLTTAAQVGNVTQVAFGELVGGSSTIGIRDYKDRSEERTTAENINQLGGNISLKSTKGDIDLNGVNLMGGKVVIDSAGKLNQRAAKSTSSSNYSMDVYSAGITGSVGVAPVGAGLGLSVGAEGLYERDKASDTSHTNGLISGSEVSIKTAGDHNMDGANINGDKVRMDIGGSQNIRSVQDSSQEDHTRGSWSASVGVAVSTDGGIVPTGSASASGGKDYDNSQLTNAQSGIDAGELHLKVGGDLNLKGSHVLSLPGQGSVQVGGKINAEALNDSRDKDGGYGGGGLGISKNGLPTVTIEAGRVDQVDYKATQKSTIDVGDPSKVSAAGGIGGKLNQDGSSLKDVTKDKKVAGTDIRATVAMEDLKTHKQNAKKAAGKMGGYDLTKPGAKDHEHSGPGPAGTYRRTDLPPAGDTPSSHSAPADASAPRPSAPSTPPVSRRDSGEAGSSQPSNAAPPAKRNDTGGTRPDEEQPTPDKSSGFGFNRSISLPGSDNPPAYQRSQSEPGSSTPRNAVPIKRNKRATPDEDLTPNGDRTSVINPIYREEDEAGH